MLIRFLILCLFIPLYLFANPTEPLVITGDKDYAPFTYLDSENKAQGFLVDIWKEWAKVNDTAIRFELKEWRQSIAAIQRSKKQTFTVQHTQMYQIPIKQKLFTKAKHLFFRVKIII